MLVASWKEVMTVAPQIVTRHTGIQRPARSGDTGQQVDSLPVAVHATRVRRLKINAVAWGIGASLITALWVWSQWDANGGFESFGFDGNPGEWNPTLWALTVGLWGLVVGIMALRVVFERPLTRAHERSVERAAQLKFHVASWGLGMVVLTPLWALIEWQDNGGLERWSSDSQPGSWEPWILYVGGFWALGIAVLALSRAYSDRRGAAP